VYWTIRRAATDRSTSNGSHHLISFSASGPWSNDLKVFARSSKIEDVRVSRVGNLSLEVSTPQWRTRAIVRRGRPHPGQVRIDVVIQPKGDSRILSRDAPHGLLGQTYDGDGIPLHGQRDSFERLDDNTLTRARTRAGGVVTTRAMGEGAIEGDSEMYRVARPFETLFKFSRFDMQSDVFAPPRNASLLRKMHMGKQVLRNQGQLLG